MVIAQIRQAMVVQLEMCNFCCDAGLDLVDPQTLGVTCDDYHADGLLVKDKVQVNVHVNDVDYNLV